jgi:carbonic anhydrase/acetyltransferase-like protein (isoleucine patch superfamily)
MVYAIGERRVVLHGDGHFIAPTAAVIGSVVLETESSVWFGTVIRGDNEPITIGARSNVQDGAVLHTDPGFPLVIGSGVTVGHQAMLHGCTIGDGSLVGIQAIVMNGAVVGRECIVGAGALIPEGKVDSRPFARRQQPRRVVRGDRPEVAVREAADVYVRKAVGTGASSCATIAGDPGFRGRERSPLNRPGLRRVNRLPAPRTAMKRLVLPSSSCSRSPLPSRRHEPRPGPRVPRRASRGGGGDRARRCRRLRLAVSGMADITLVQECGRVGADRGAAEAARSHAPRSPRRHAPHRQRATTGGFMGFLFGQPAAIQATITFRDLQAVDMSGSVKLKADGWRRTSSRSRSRARQAAHRRPRREGARRRRLRVRSRPKSPARDRAWRIAISGAGDYRAAGLAE